MFNPPFYLDCDNLLLYFERTSVKILHQHYLCPSEYYFFHIISKIVAKVFFPF